MTGFRFFPTAFLVAAICAPVPALADLVTYVCDDGFRIPVLFQGQDTAIVMFPDTPAVTLNAQPVGSGMHYEGGGVTLRGKGDDATITRASDGNAFVCQALTGQRQDAGAPAAPPERQGTGGAGQGEPSGFNPSFPCGAGGLNSAEIAVCKSSELSDLDRRLDELFGRRLSESTPADQERLNNNQTAWRGGRDGCRDIEPCLLNAYRSQLDELENFQPIAASGPGASPPGADAPRLSRPVKGRSYGGKVRRKPSMDAAQAGSLKEGDPILLRRATGDIMGEHEWFEIEWRGKRGFHWGGIMCAEEPVKGVLDVCQN